MTSDVNAYHKARERGNLQLHLLDNGRLVSSTMVQNPDLHYSSRRLPPDEGIRRDYEPNVIIHDTVSSVQRFDACAKRQWLV